MFDRFTERARKVMSLALEETKGMGHRFVGVEHLLLGIAREGTGVAATAVRELGLRMRTVEARVRISVKKGDAFDTFGQLPFTPRVKTALELALDEAETLGHNYIGTEHLLLGLMREKRGVAAWVLDDLGLDVVGVRGAILDVLDSAGSDEED